MQNNNEIIIMMIINGLVIAYFFYNEYRKRKNDISSEIDKKSEEKFAKLHQSHLGDALAYAAYHLTEQKFITQVKIYVTNDVYQKYRRSIYNMPVNYRDNFIKFLQQGCEVGQAIQIATKYNGDISKFVKDHYWSFKPFAEWIEFEPIDFKIQVFDLKSTRQNSHDFAIQKGIYEDLKNNSGKTNFEKLVPKSKTKNETFWNEVFLDAVSELAGKEEVKKHFNEIMNVKDGHKRNGVIDLLKAGCKLLKSIEISNVLDGDVAQYIQVHYNNHWKETNNKFYQHVGRGKMIINLSTPQAEDLAEKLLSKWDIKTWSYETGNIKPTVNELAHFINQTLQNYEKR